MANNPQTGLNAAGIAEQGLDGHAFLNSLTNQLASSGAKAQTTGAATTNQGAAQLTNLSQFFQNILGGGNEMTQALAPQSEQVLGQYDAARKNLAVTNGRGGGNASDFLNLATAPISESVKNTAAARGAAANSLDSIGSQLAQIGSQEQQIGVSSQSNAGSLAESRNQLDATTGFASTFKNALGSGLGSGLAKIATGGFSSSSTTDPSGGVTSTVGMVI